jgi:hypothetical protein
MEGVGEAVQLATKATLDCRQHERFPSPRHEKEEVLGRRGAGVGDWRREESVYAWTDLNNI